MTTEASVDAPILARRLVAGAIEWTASEWRSLPRADVVPVQRELAALRRRVDAALATASAEVSRRSEADDGAAGLARREGFATPAKLVASATRGSTAEASRLIAVGEVTLAAADASACGESRGASGARFAALAAAIAAGSLSVDAASAISAMLTRVLNGGRVEPEALAKAERDLVERALDLPLDRLVALVRQIEARLDREAHRRREEMTYEARYLNVFENRSGVVTVDGRLDVATAAPLRAAIDALVSDALRRRRDQDPARADDRTVPQMRADALADLARHALGCEATDRALATTTVVVRMTLDDLRSGDGVGEIDGVDEPVSVGTLRRIAADAEVIPCVLGTDDEVLNLGRARRLFTRAQRIALGERDGGCAFCHAPPSWTDAHHIRWWERDAGPTDLDNGVLLCTACHHRVHRDGWGIRIRAGTVEFVPPSSVDRSHTPILGGRARFGHRTLVAA